MPRKRKSRIYLKRGRYYGDFRDYADVGGGKEALVPARERFATEDPVAAKELADARIEELERLRRNRVDVEPDFDLTRLGDFVDHHLEREAALTENTTEWLEQVNNHLQTAIGYFGERARLRDITTPQVTDYAIHLMTIPKWGHADARHGMIGRGSQRKYLNSLSKLFRRAIAEGVVPQTHNPVAGMLEKPSGDYVEAEWLEVHEAALVLHGARLYRPKRADLALPCAYPLIATLLLTGGRKAEVLGLEVSDIDFTRKTVTFRRKAHRRLKTRGAYRVVTLWPQLEAILRDYLAGPHAPKGHLLFPSTGAAEQPIGDIRRLLDEVAISLGRDEGSLHTKMFRHTYCAARLQTTDHGAAIAEYTVVQELGHNSHNMVREIYGHLGSVRHRSEVVEFRVEQFAEALADRIREVEHRSRQRNTIENLRNRVAPEVEAAILAITREMPNCGPKPVARELYGRGVVVSDTGVRGVWQRHGLETIEKRLEAVQAGRVERLVAAGGLSDR